MTAQLRLIVAPGETYACLARVPSRIGPLAALRRPLLVAVVLGVSIAIAATGHVTPGLVLSTTFSWSFVGRGETYGPAELSASVVSGCRRVAAARPEGWNWIDAVSSGLTTFALAALVALGAKERLC